MSPSLNPTTGIDLLSSRNPTILNIYRTSAHNEPNEDDSEDDDGSITGDEDITHKECARKFSGAMPRHLKTGRFQDQDDNATDGGTAIPMTTFSTTARVSHVPNHPAYDLQHQPSAPLMSSTIPVSRINLKRGRVEDDDKTQPKKKFRRHTWRKEINIDLVDTVLGQVLKVCEGLEEFGCLLSDDICMEIDDILHVSMATLSTLKRNLKRV
jgi:hypothetical protein